MCGLFSNEVAEHMPRRTGFKLLGGALTCPPGFFCMDFSTICFGVLIALIVVGAIVYVVKSSQKPEAVYPIQYPFVKEQRQEEGKVEEEDEDVVFAKQAPKKKHRKHKTVAVMEEETPIVVVQQPANTTIDHRFAPLSPEQSYETYPDIRGMPSPPISAGLGPIMPINVQTRGYPDTYQQIGVLTTAGGSDTSASPTRTILPLFGRKLITNRDRWNYYTRTDGLNPVQVPVHFKRRNCDLDNGCDEIMEGDSVSVPIIGQSYTASVYRYSTPRYIPMV